MKKLICLIVISISFLSLKSQTLKIENGVSISSFSSSKYDLFGKKVFAYSGFIGCDYLEHEHYLISSEIGYMRVGGKDNSTIFTNPDNVYLNQGPISEFLDYLHLNTTFRVKFSYGKSFLYAGFGPKLDILMNSKSKEDILLNAYSFKKYMFGFKPEIGIQNELTEKISVGINAFYLLNVNDSGSNNYDNIRNNAFAIMLSLGYKL